MKYKRKVNILAEKLSYKKKPDLLNNIFKTIILKKFKNLKIGFIEITDNNNIYSFGNSKCNMKI